MPTQPSPYSDSSCGDSVRKTLRNRKNQNSSPVAAQPLQSHRYDLSSLKPETWNEARNCWYCGLPFRPTVKSAWESHFCCTAHRQAHNKYGSMPFEKIMLAIGQNTLVEISKAGPMMKAELLKGLGLKGYMLMDSESPINLYAAAEGLMAPSPSSQ